MNHCKVILLDPMHLHRLKSLFSLNPWPFQSASLREIEREDNHQESCSYHHKIVHVFFRDRPFSREEIDSCYEERPECRDSADSSSKSAQGKWPRW